MMKFSMRVCEAATPPSSDRIPAMSLVFVSSSPLSLLKALDLSIRRSNSSAAPVPCDPALAVPAAGGGAAGCVAMSCAAADIRWKRSRADSDSAEGSKFAAPAKACVRSNLACWGVPCEGPRPKRPVLPVPAPTKGDCGSSGDPPVPPRPLRKPPPAGCTPPPPNIVRIVAKACCCCCSSTALWITFEIDDTRVPACEDVELEPPPPPFPYPLFR